MWILGVGVWGCFPRIRGDVPTIPHHHVHGAWFSPHTRGCSGGRRLLRRRALVFPAYAGMFPRARGRGGSVGGFPRIRGDVPLTHTQIQIRLRFSPHTRGCSGYQSSVASSHAVFPAYAGMFRVVHRVCRACRCFPRIRGDVPPPTIQP